MKSPDQSFLVPRKPILIDWSRHDRQPGVFRTRAGVSRQSAS